MWQILCLGCLFFQLAPVQLTYPPIRRPHPIDNPDFVYGNLELPNGTSIEDIRARQAAPTYYRPVQVHPRPYQPRYWNPYNQYQQYRAPYHCDYHHPGYQYPSSHYYPRQVYSGVRRAPVQTTYVTRPPYYTQPAYTTYPEPVAVPITPQQGSSGYIPGQYQYFRWGAPTSRQEVRIQPLPEVVA